MKKINKDIILMYYKMKLKDKNWGCWPNSTNWPEIGIGYTVTQ